MKITAIIILLLSVVLIFATEAIENKIDEIKK